MKTLNVHFNDGEWKKLSKAKSKSGLTWREFILQLVLKGGLENENRKKER